MTINFVIKVKIDSLTLQELEEWYDERMCEFKDFDEFLITMAYHGMKDDQRRSKKMKEGCAATQK